MIMSIVCLFLAFVFFGIWNSIFPMIAAAGSGAFFRRFCICLLLAIGVWQAVFGG